eukprot:11148486-Ditylum_brightwellii.AAC.1
MDADSLSLICDNITIESIAMKSSTIGEESRSQQDHDTVIYEGLYSRVFCFRDYANKYSSHAGSLALKSLSDEFPDDKHLSRLENEYIISRHLMSCNCKATRAALLRPELRSPISIFLEWAAGETLTEWIKSIHGTECINRRPTLICESNLKSISQLALNISNALSEIHDACVTHNNLSPQHIIVDINGEKDIMSVKIIGLGSASLLPDSCKISSKSRKDIISLGSILFEMLTGSSPFITESDDSFFEGESDSMTFKSRNQLITILTAKLPLDFAKLILDIIEAKGSLRFFEAARNVSKELLTITNNLGNIGKPGASKIVLVSGHSGAGKSAL